jgi:hypothetical protein
LTNWRSVSFSGRTLLHGVIWLVSLGKDVVIEWQERINTCTVGKKVILQNSVTGELKPTNIPVINVKTFLNKLNISKTYKTHPILKPYLSIFCLLDTSV